jgi:hypothetical protein
LPPEPFSPEKGLKIGQQGLYYIYNPSKEKEFGVNERFRFKNPRPEGTGEGTE